MTLLIYANPTIELSFLGNVGGRGGLGAGAQELWSIAYNLLWLFSLRQKKIPNGTLKSAL